MLLFCIFITFLQCIFILLILAPFLLKLVEEKKRPLEIIKNKMSWRMKWKGSHKEGSLFLDDENEGGGSQRELVA